MKETELEALGFIKEPHRGYLRKFGKHHVLVQKNLIHIFYIGTPICDPVELSSESLERALQALKKIILINKPNTPRV